MANSPSRWTALVAEAVLIVVSILLAFAIDAGWDRRLEQARRVALLADLRSDFAATSAALEGAIAEGQEDVDRTDGFLRIVTEAEPVSRDSLLTLFSGVNRAVFFQPTVASYRSALSDGSIALLRSAVLTRALTDFDLQVDLYQLHLELSGDLFFLGAVQDLRRAVGSLRGLVAPPGSGLRALVPADFDLRGRLAVATVEPVWIAQLELLKSLVSMRDAADRIVVEIDALLE